MKFHEDIYKQSLAMFVLYINIISGSTGKPKGVLHSTAGYLLNATMTTKLNFDLREGDVYGKRTLQS